MKYSIPPTANPWRILEHDGARFMVRISDGACWIVRKDAPGNPGAIFVHELADAPAWALGEPGKPGEQQDLFGCAG